MAGWLQVLQTVAGVRQELKSLSVETQASGGESPADAFGGGGGEGPADAFGGKSPSQSPGLRTLGGMGGRTAEVAKKVVQEAGKAAKATDAATKKLEEIFGDLAAFDETSREMLKAVVQASTGFYTGADLLRRVMDVLNGLEKGGPNAQYVLQDRLGDLVQLIQTYMGREGQTITEQTFYGFRNRRNRRNRYTSRKSTAQSGTSTGVNP
jgi:hypothetical protein